MHLELTPEQRAFRASIEQFAAETVAPRAAAIDESGAFPLDVMRAAAARGLCGVTVPRAWGGAGLDYLSYILAIEAVARASATVAAALSVNNSLVAEVVAHAGRAPQRDAWLRRLATGEAIGSFALSEPEGPVDTCDTRALHSIQPDDAQDQRPHAALPER
jgi:alkylation response protein AidB-like acyl-CoA dehydrogenase